jgi:RNase_H superfamily
VERLAQVLGATTKTNQYGEFLSVRCWCAQPPSFSPDPRALKLLLPETPEEIANPDEWLFLDTETTGLSGGSGTYPFLVGLAWWEGGGLEIEQLFMREYSRGAIFVICIARTNRGTPGPRHIQREELRLAAARNPLSHDPQDFCTDPPSTSRFPSPGTAPLATATWFGAAVRA